VDGRESRVMRTSKYLQLRSRIEDAERTDTGLDAGQTVVGQFPMTHAPLATQATVTLQMRGRVKGVIHILGYGMMRESQRHEARWCLKNKWCQDTENPF
jgi:hypothetical protein